jgi:hypothetical protein
MYHDTQLQDLNITVGETVLARLFYDSRESQQSAVSRQFEHLLFLAHAHHQPQLYANDHDCGAV